MKIAVAGTGYVGLVTGVVFAHIGHNVTCVDVDENKIEKMKNGISPIYEQDLEKLMLVNKERLTYTTDYKEAYKDADVIFIGVGTPERSDGSANLEYVYKVCDNIAESIEKDCVVVVKSTVPIGTNDEVEKYIQKNIKRTVNVYVASNPEFLAQGTAVHDTLYASRIVVGTENESAKKIMEDVYLPLTREPYNVPYLNMNRRSAEMVKYASNDFLALKISYINEISNFCEKTGADINDVTRGMSFDSRIGSKFLNPGVGYGGSCFPKDTKALHRLSVELDSELKTIQACIEVNKKQKLHLFDSIIEDFKELKGLNVGVLGTSFKPGTDDLREAPAIENVKLLLEYGCNITVYDPVSLDNFSKIFGNKINYELNLEKCISNKDFVMIMTEWDQIKNIKPEVYDSLMKTPYIYDGRNCYDLIEMKSAHVKYVSMGRNIIDNLK